MTDQEARHSTTCPGCGGVKELGQTVCWDCWKRPDHPYKYFEGELQDWVELVKSNK